MASSIILRLQWRGSLEFPFSIAANFSADGAKISETRVLCLLICRRVDGAMGQTDLSVEIPFLTENCVSYDVDITF